MNPGDFTSERAFRAGLLESLRATDPNLTQVPSKTIHDLGVFAGGRGTYAPPVQDDLRTSQQRIVLSVLHTGKQYADELSDESLIYHFPATQKPGYDRSDIEACRVAMQLGLPVFVILSPISKSPNRSVRVGYIVDVDDRAQQSLISFAEHVDALPKMQLLPDDAAFAATLEERRMKRRTTNTRNNDQAKFSFNVAKRYGVKCAVCQIRVPGLIDAAHVVPVSVLGSDDARNGLPLCSNHHRAFDSYLFSFVGTNCEIVPTSVRSLKELGVTETFASTLTGALPHPTAISLCNDLRKTKP